MFISPTCCSNPGLPVARQKGAAGRALRNGDLVTAAFQAGFDTLLTRDRLFAESASRTWRKFPAFGVVIVTLPQLPSQRYLEAFAAAWIASPIQPIPGTIVVWP